MSQHFENLDKFTKFISSTVSTISERTMGWVAIIILHAATVPTFLAVMSGLTDKFPPVDFILLIWTGLALMFVRAAIARDMLYLVTIGFGFMAQAGMLALIFIK
jgi:hypothetical protein